MRMNRKIALFGLGVLALAVALIVVLRTPTPSTTGAVQPAVEARVPTDEGERPASAGPPLESRDPPPGHQRPAEAAARPELEVADRTDAPFDVVNATPAERDAIETITDEIAEMGMKIKQAPAEDRREEIWKMAGYRDERLVAILGEERAQMFLEAESQVSSVKVVRAGEVEPDTDADARPDERR